MKLLYQTHSPYARKALVFAHEAGLADMLEVIHEETSPTQKNAEVFAQNPLGKVPVLIRDEGSAIFDSDVICAYLNTMALRSLYPAGGEERWAALRLQALAKVCAMPALHYAGNVLGVRNRFAMSPWPKDMS